QQGAGADLTCLADDTQICNCNTVCKGTIVESIRAGKNSVEAIGDCTRAGTGCGSCQPILGHLLQSYSDTKEAAPKNKIEVMKEEKNGLDCLPDLERLMPTNNWAEMTEDDKQRAKWNGLFFRKPTPGNFMLRLRMDGGRSNSRQFRVIADLSDEYG